MTNAVRGCFSVLCLAEKYLTKVDKQQSVAYLKKQGHSHRSYLQFIKLMQTLGVRCRRGLAGRMAHHIRCWFILYLSHSQLEKQLTSC